MIDFMYWMALLLLCGCSAMPQSENQHARKPHEVQERIYRYSKDQTYKEMQQTRFVRDLYLWEKQYALQYSPITKDFFRCKGGSFDCGGIEKHGLPYIQEEENVYEILIELLNYVQEKLQAKVIVTSGHRCPEHNSYVDGSKANLYSKHQIGAEVDFYVEQYTERPQEVVKWVMQYYHDKGLEEYLPFFRSEKKATLYWYNKEIALRIIPKDQGRNFDNRHPYAYITIEVLYDKNQNRRVEYLWHKAHTGYLMY